MIKPMKTVICLTILASLALTRPALAQQQQQQDPAVAFQANVQRALDTLNQMQALFARIDQRHKDQAAGTASGVGTTTAPEAGATSAAPNAPAAGAGQ